MHCKCFIHCANIRSRQHDVPPSLPFIKRHHPHPTPAPSSAKTAASCSAQRVTAAEWLALPGKDFWAPLPHMYLLFVFMCVLCVHAHVCRCILKLLLSQGKAQTALYHEQGPRRQSRLLSITQPLRKRQFVFCSSWHNPLPTPFLTLNFSRGS